LHSQHFLYQYYICTKTSQFQLRYYRIPETVSNSTSFCHWISWSQTLFDQPLDFDIDPVLHPVTLMPDSLTLIKDSTENYNYVNTHALGMIMDPSVDPMVDILEGFGDNTQYSILSVKFPYQYTRGLSNEIVDTLRIQIMKHSDSIQTVAHNWLNQAESEYQPVPFSSQGNVLFNGLQTEDILFEIKIPLTEADTSQDPWSILEVTAGGTNMSPGQHFGVFIDYLPGFNYTLGDSLKNLNQFSLFSYEENESELPIYMNTLNKTYIIPSTVLYDLDTIWSGHFIPTIYYGANYTHEYLLMDFELCPIFGVDHHEMNEFNLTITPNPSSGEFTVQWNYELENITMYLRDVLGKKILQAPMSPINNQLSLGELKKGLYFLQLTDGKNSITKKLILN